jgi:hypothetical protein
MDDSPNAPDNLNANPYRELSRHSRSTIWYVRFSQVEEDYICWQEGTTGYVTKVSSGSKVASWSSFVPQDFTAGDLTAPATSKPVVSISSPSDGASYSPGSTVNIAAQVSEGGATIETVTFSVNGATIKTFSSGPYGTSGNAESEGTYKIVVSATDTQGENTQRSVTISVAGMYAYPDKAPHALPGRIEAEHFNLGGEGLAYHDSDAGNTRGTFRSQEDVDVADGATGRYVTSTSAGEWLRYTVSMAEEKACAFAIAVANGSSAGTFHIELDGSDLTGAIQGTTGSYDSWQELVVNNLTLPAGEHVLTLAFDETGHIVDYIEVREPTAVITLTGPNGETDYNEGDTLIVTWATDESQVNDVVVEITIDGGQSWSPLVEGSVDVNSSSWGRLAILLEGRHVSDQVLVRVSEYGGSRHDVSDDMFAATGTATAGAANAEHRAMHRVTLTARRERLLVDAHESMCRLRLLELRGRTQLSRPIHGRHSFALHSGTYVVRIERGAASKVSHVTIP